MPGAFVIAQEPVRALARRASAELGEELDERLTDRVEYWAKAEERLIRELSITKTLRTPVNFIVHTLQEVNDGLAHGRVQPPKLIRPLKLI